MITALYDGNCVICRGTRRVVKTFDWFQRVEFLDLHQRELVQIRYPHLDYVKMMGEIHVVTQHGQLFAGFHGTKRLLKELPLGFPLWCLLHLPGMTWLGKHVYRWIAKRRYAINRLMGVSCDDGGCQLS